MNWINLETESQLLDLKHAQENSIIFKHSTRCSISLMTKRNLEADAAILPEDIKCYYLDLLKFRVLSNQIADIFQVHHESPQLLAIKNGDCILDQSHGDISLEEAIEELKRD